MSSAYPTGWIDVFVSAVILAAGLSIPAAVTWGAHGRLAAFGVFLVVVGVIVSTWHLTMFYTLNP